MQSTFIAVCFIFTLFLSFGALLVWGMRPLLSHRESDAYRQFVLTDMYVLVLQIALTGLFLRNNFAEESRFLSMLLFCSLVLALLWRFIVAALDDNAIRGGWQRVLVLCVAPFQILAGPVIPLVGIVWMDRNAWSWQPWVCIVAGVLIPAFARTVHLWALRTGKAAAG